jgi:hypothetical protein
MKRWKAMAIFAAAALGSWLVVRLRPVAMPPPQRAAVLAGPVAAPQPEHAVAPEPTSLAGTVRSADRAPIGGARVCATESGSAWLGTSQPSCVVSDSQGRYAISPIAPGSYALAAEAEQFMPDPKAENATVVVLPGEEKTGVDIVLQHGGARAAGMVVDATGGPVAGATVRVTRGSPARDIVTTSTHEDGTFVLWVTPGPIALTAAAEGYASARAFRVAPSSNMVLTLTPGSTVGGHVVSAKDGSPVAQVEVRAVPAGSWPSAVHPSGTSASDGAFKVSGLEPGTYTLVAEGSGWRGQSPLPIALGLAQGIDDIVVTVAPSASVLGRVLRRSDGQPCERGTVTLGPADGQPSPYDPPEGTNTPPPAAPPPGTTVLPVMMSAIEPSGAVRFPAVPPGTYRVSIQSPELALAEGPRTIEVGASDVKDIVWKVDPGLGIIVHVVDGAERPVPNGRFRLVWPEAGKGRGRITMPLSADADGRYEVPGVLYPAVYTLEPDGGYTGAPVDVDLREGQGKVDAIVRLAGKGVVLVKVRTAGGEPVDDVKVTAAALNDAARPPPSAASASAADRPEGSGPANRPGPPPPPILATALGNGRFRIGPLDGGKYELQVTDGVNPVAPAPGSPDALVTVASGATVEAVVTLDRRSSIRGRVVDAAQQGVPDVWVKATCRAPDRAASRSTEPLLPQPSRRILTDPEGRFALDGLAANNVCSVDADQPGGASGTATDVHPGDADVTVVLPALGALRGVAVSDDGRSVDHFMIAIQDASNRSKSEMIASPGGKWEIAKVNPGHLTLFASDAQGATAQQTIDLASGQTLEGVRLELRSGTIGASQTP